MLTSATNLRERLSRDELHQLRWLLGLVLVLLAFWTLFSLEGGNFAGLAVITGLVLCALVFPAWPGWIPAWAWRLFLPLGTALMMAFMISGRSDLLSSMVLLVSLLTLYRSLQYRRRREDWQLVLLSMFIIVLSGVLTLSLLFGLQILIFTIIAMALLFVMNLLDRDATRALTRADWKGFRWPHFLGRLYRALDLRLLMMSCGLFAILVAVGTVIFIAMPRYQFDQGFSFSRLKGQAGFRTNIEYQPDRTIGQDDTIALRVDVPPGFSFGALPYWRMIVLDQYNPSGFSISATLKVLAFNKTVHYSPPLVSMNHLKGVAARPGKWKLYLEGNVSEFLPILGPFSSLTFSSPQAFRENEKDQVYQIDAPSPNVLGYEIENMAMDDVMPVGDDGVRNLTRATYDEAYNAKKNAAIKEEETVAENAHRPPVIDGIHPHLGYPYTCLDLPATDEDRHGLDQIVSGIRAQRADPSKDMSEADFLTAAVQYLRQNHAASDSVHLTDKDPGHDTLIQWMESHQGGWCEYFAGSLVLLARAAGYPARIAAGFKGATYNAIEDYYFVRQSDAHAWAEVYTPADAGGPDRWVRWDPTPGPESFPLGSNATAADLAAAGGVQTERGWSARLDSLRMLWYRRVINFDQTDQAQFASWLADFSKNFLAALKDWLLECGKEFYSWLAQPLTALRVGIISGLLALMAFVWRARERIQNWWLHWSGRGLLARMNHLAPVRRDAGHWLRRFQPAWELAAPTLPPPDRAEWDGVRYNLLALRYGPLDASPDPAGTFRRARLLLKQTKA